MQKIKIFGDSHVVYFRREPLLAQKYNLKDFYDNSVVKAFHGGSIKGFGKRTSKSTLNLKEEILKNLDSSDICVLCFGQVDIELGIYYKRFVKGENISDTDFIKECLEAYQNLFDILATKSSQIIVKGINAPVLQIQGKAIRYTQRIITENVEDKTKILEMEKIFKKSFPDIEKRIGLSVSFNNLLKLLCDKNNVVYFDINNEIADAKGYVKEEFLPASFDHHLADTIKTRKLYCTYLVNSIKYGPNGLLINDNIVDLSSSDASASKSSENNSKIEELSKFIKK